MGPAVLGVLYLSSSSSGGSRFSKATLGHEVSASGSSAPSVTRLLLKCETGFAELHVKSGETSFMISDFFLWD